MYFVGDVRIGGCGFAAVASFYLSDVRYVGRCTGVSFWENTERDAHKQQNIIFAAIYRQLSYLAIICALRICEQATFDGGFRLCCDTEP